MIAPDGWDTWASHVVTAEHLKAQGLHPAQRHALDQSLARLERTTMRAALAASAHQRWRSALDAAIDDQISRREQRQRRVRIVAICAAVLVAVVVLASCAPTPAEPSPPTIDDWTTITARAGLTPSAIGACVAAIDTAIAAELVKAHNAAAYEYGPMPQAGFAYDVPTETINCEGVTG